MAVKGGEITVAETSRHLKVTPATASRILASLRECGIVEQDLASRRYRPGVLALRLAKTYAAASGSVSEIEVTLDTLVERTTYSAWAGVLDGAEIAVLRTRNGSHPIRFTLPTDWHLPASATALGKALLALKPEGDVEKLFMGKDFGGTESAHKSIEELLEDIRVVKERRYAISDQELFQGIRSIAVAFDVSSMDRAVALGISYPIFSLRPGEEEKILQALLDEAGNYELRTGDTGL
jgi:DNA-binding IclR family transcriptional regulator